MLNGIGGCTIAQAKENMSHAEAVEWAKYIRARGSLNMGKRIDRGFAMLTMWLLRVNGGKAELEDFLPYAEKPPEKPASAAAVFALLKSIKK